MFLFFQINSRPNISGRYCNVDSLGHEEQDAKRFEEAIQMIDDIFETSQVRNKLISTKLKYLNSKNAVLIVNVEKTRFVCIILTLYEYT